MANLNRSAVLARMTILELYSRANEKWTTGLNHVATRGEWAYVAFLFGVFPRCSGGWRVNRSVPVALVSTLMPICIERRRWQRTLQRDQPYLRRAPQ